MVYRLLPGLFVLTVTWSSTPPNTPLTMGTLYIGSFLVKDVQETEHGERVRMDDNAPEYRGINEVSFKSPPPCTLA